MMLTVISVNSQIVVNTNFVYGVDRPNMVNFLYAGNAATLRSPGSADCQCSRESVTAAPLSQPLHERQPYRSRGILDRDSVNEKIGGA
jgi:hypothetical protein